MVSVSLWQNLTSVNFILSSSPLTTSHSYLQEREELAEVDLRKLLELKPPDQAGNLEQQCSFQIVLAERCPLLPFTLDHALFTFLEYLCCIGV